MNQETMRVAVDAFVLDRINDCSSIKNDALAEAFSQLSMCVDRLRGSLSKEQIALLIDCENAYSLVDGETMNCFYRAGFSDAVLFWLGWRDEKWN